MTQTITALFDDQAEAQTALSKLVAAGIPQSAIRLTPGAATAATRSTGGYDHTRDEGGFWASLKGMFMPEEDRYAYTEGLSRGGTMLSASVEDAHVETAYDILEANGSVNLDERETTWRQEGWKGYAAGTDATTFGTATAGSAVGAASMTTGAGTGGVAAQGTNGTDYIPIVEERLNVGKRVVDHGRVRIRSYAVETPVSEQVTLRDETVQVERRPVDRALTAADATAFTDRTIEAVERDEEAVVSKEARVVEEVGLRKEATQRTETVQDKVRRTEVEVEDERGGVSRTGTTGSTTIPPKR